MKTELEQENDWNKLESKVKQEYNETFNPEAHSSLITDFGKDDVIETIEEGANNYVLLVGNLTKIENNKTIIDFIAGAKSDASKNYWFKIFQEEQKSTKNREPCQYCNTNHLDYACDKQIKFIKEQNEK